MKVTFLGTGTSHGVPLIGCDCETCLSDDIKDKRFNSSVMIEHDDKVVLIDCGADFRHQALKYNILKINSVVITHNHFDHIVGLDNLRVYNHRQKQTIPIYGSSDHLNYMKKYIFHYMFGDAIQKGGGISELELNAVSGVFDVDGITFTCLPVKHGKMSIYGYRFNDISYLSDVSFIPDETIDLIRGSKILIIDALRYRSHSTHFSVADSLSVIEKVKPEKAYFTHMCHDIRHAVLLKELQDKNSEYYINVDVEPAYDGLSFSL